MNLAEVQLPDAGTYSVLVSNAGGTASGSATLSVTTGTAVPPPVILNGPESQSVPAGSDVSLTVQASGSDLSYQWQHNGANIPGATDSALNLAAVQVSDSGTYTVLVSNAGGSVNSSASLTVTTGTTVQPPVIIAGPQSQSVPVGSDLTLTVQAGGSELTYQWQHEGTNLAGATGSALNLENVSH